MKHTKIINALLAGISIFSITYYVSVSRRDIGNATMDDAWMFMRYAKHYIEGSGFSWNSQDGPSYGTTSILYLFFITATRTLSDWPDSLVLAGVSFVFGLISCIVLVFLGFLCAEGISARKYWTPLLIIPGLLLMPAFRYHSLSGMETTLSLFMNALLACSTIIWSHRQTTSNFVLCIIAGYLCFLARPDNGLYALLLPPIYLAVTDQRLRRYSMQYVIVFVLVLGLDGVLKQLLLGSFVPFSFFAKSSGFYKGYLGIEKWNAMTEMIVFWSTSLPFTILVILLSNRRISARLIAIGIPVLLTFGYYARVVQIMGYNSRFYYPTLPFFIMSAFITLSSSQERVNDNTTVSRGSLMARVLMIVVALLPILFDSVGNKASSWWQRSVIGTPTVFRTHKQYVNHIDADLPPLAWSDGIIEIGNLLQRMPPGTVLAASEYGVIGAEFPDTTIVDLVGLNDKYIAQNGFSVEYILSQKPDIIWFPDPDYSYEIAMILDDDTFALYYDYYPAAYNYGIAIRTKSDSFAIINTIVKDEFSRIYPGLEMSDYRAKPILY